jgi:hypothetical protein
MHANQQLQKTTPWSPAQGLNHNSRNRHKAASVPILCKQQPPLLFHPHRFGNADHVHLLAIVVSFRISVFRAPAVPRPLNDRREISLLCPCSPGLLCRYIVSPACSFSRFFLVIPLIYQLSDIYVVAIEKPGWRRARETRRIRSKAICVGTRYIRVRGGPVMERGKKAWRTLDNVWAGRDGRLLVGWKVFGHGLKRSQGERVKISVTFSISLGY